MTTEYQILNPFKQIWLKLQYFFATLKEFYRYPYVLAGELCDNTPKTVIMYRIKGKRDIYDSSAEEICNDSKLIGNFHPLDVRTIAYICGVEQAMGILEEKRIERLTFIKNRIFKK